MFKSLSEREVCDRLLSAVNPLILIHVKPDGDAIGSAAALCRFYEVRGQRASIACADPIPARLAFLTDGLTIASQNDLANSGDRTVLAVDVASPAQLGTLAAHFTGTSSPDLMIDHHAVGTPFADHYILPDAAAAGEILTVLFRRMSESGLIPDLPQALWSALYASVSSDTGCFKYANASAGTHRIAADLLAEGVDAAHINHLLFDSKSLAQLRAEALVVERMRQAADGKINYVILPRADMTRDGMSEENFETAIDIVRSLAGTVIAFVLKEQEIGIYKVSLRSTGADVAAVAAGFGGGGHIRAAGCTVKTSDPVAAEKLLLEALTPLLV